MLKAHISESSVIAVVKEKIRAQWASIRKSFHDLSRDKSSCIEAAELRHFLTHWGILLNEAKFQELYASLDEDGDGKITYQDFQRTLGREIHPGEGLYFRQDQPFMLKINTCEYPKCWQAT